MDRCEFSSESLRAGKVGKSKRSQLANRRAYHAVSLCYECGHSELESGNDSSLDVACRFNGWRK